MCTTSLLDQSRLEDPTVQNEWNLSPQLKCLCQICRKSSQVAIVEYAQVSESTKLMLLMPLMSNWHGRQFQWTSSKSPNNVGTRRNESGLGLHGLNKTDTFTPSLSTTGSQSVRHQHSEAEGCLLMSKSAVTPESLLNSCSKHASPGYARQLNLCARQCSTCNFQPGLDA